jgi:NhaA family Na+:H+ antiporter
MPGGALHTWRFWSTAIVAALGGMAGAAIVYLAFVQLSYETLLIPGWPVACAIDAAATYYVLKVLFPRSGVLPFALLLAITTNVVGVFALGFRDVTLEARTGGAALLLAALAVAGGLRLRQVRSFWPYLLLAGTLSWFAFYLEGMHPAFALVPIVPFLPHRPRRQNPFADPTAHGAVPHAEREWNAIAQAVLFLFGLVNAGVILRGVDTGSWAVLSAAVIGRPVGALAAIALALAVGFRLPAHLHWRELIVIALATSSGFTFALFAATSLLPPGAVLTQIKLGALATVAGAVVAYAAAWRLHVGRFATAASSA